MNEVKKEYSALTMRSVSHLLDEKDRQIETLSAKLTQIKAAYDKWINCEGDPHVARIGLQLALMKIFDGIEGTLVNPPQPHEKQSTGLCDACAIHATCQRPPDTGFVAKCPVYASGHPQSRAEDEANKGEGKDHGNK